MIQAVIFDMDGVLIDSEPVYLKKTYEVLRQTYPWITEESLYPTVGMSAKEFDCFMAELCHKEPDDLAFKKELTDVFHDFHLNYRTIMRPQVPEVLEKLKTMGLQIALASSSSMKNIEQVLGDCQIRDYFEFVVSGEAFERSKPDPEIYCVTMELLGRLPEECLVIEDSTYGIVAGIKAGAAVAALRDERFSFQQELATLQIESLDEIPGIASKGNKFERK